MGEAPKAPLWMHLRVPWEWMCSDELVAMHLCTPRPRCPLPPPPLILLWKLCVGILFLRARGRLQPGVYITYIPL